MHCQESRLHCQVVGGFSRVPWRPRLHTREIPVLSCLQRRAARANMAPSSLASVSARHLEVASDLFPDYPQGFPYENFDIKQVAPPSDDDMGIASDDEDVREEDVETESGFGSVIVVGNLPVIPAEKFDKLAAVVKKVLGSIGTIREGGFFMPQDASGTTKGFAFVEFSSPKEAAAAKEQVHGYKLDKAHTFAVNMFDDIDKYARVPDQYQALAPKEFKSPGNLYSWMTDKLGRDQFVIKAGEDTQVSWNDGKRNRSEEVYHRPHWTETFVQWSPLGTYITTLHRQGAAAWGGPNWERINRYAHSNVRLLEYSPNEKYLITYSSQEPHGPHEKVMAFFSVHDVRSARKLRVFEGPADEFAVGSSAGVGGALKWPVFKWAGGKEDKFFARLGKNTISVYEAPEMTLLDKKSLKMDGVQDFEWSPSEPILAAYTTEQNQLPARIVLVKLPERTEVRQKNLFNVSDIRICWHPQGDYMAVKVDRFSKSKKNTYTGFELFSVRDKDIPMEVLELPNKNEKIITFAWEPKGHRFAIVHGDGPRPSVSIYSMRDEKGRLAVKHVHTMANKACTHVYWSPMGRHIVLAGLKTFNGQLEFFSVDELETMATAEHFMCTDVEWDPTGRYVASSVAGNQMENGFNMWSFQGKLLYVMPKERLFQFSWRPRLPSLLTPEKEAEIAKNLKQWSKKYDEEDEALLMQADADVLQERQKYADEWSDYQARRAEYVALVDGFKRQMYGSRYEEGEFTIETVTVEQVVETKEEKV